MRRPVAASAAADEARHRDETWPQWASRTGRIPASEVAYWEAQVDNERRRVMASAGRSDGLNEIEEMLRILHPALREVQAAAAYAAANWTRRCLTRKIGRWPIPAPRTGERFRKERERQQDLIAEASYREQLQAEEEWRASTAFTDEEEAVLFAYPGSPSNEADG